MQLSLSNNNVHFKAIPKIKIGGKYVLDLRNYPPETTARYAQDTLNAISLFNKAALCIRGKKNVMTFESDTRMPLVLSIKYDGEFKEELDYLQKNSLTEQVIKSILNIASEYGFDRKHNISKAINTVFPEYIFKPVKGKPDLVIRVPIDSSGQANNDLAEKIPLEDYFQKIMSAGKQN